MERFMGRFRRNRQEQHGPLPSELPNVEDMSGVRTSEQQDEYVGTQRSFARNLVSNAMPNRAYQMPEQGDGTGRVITEMDIIKAERKLKEFKAGKASVERRIKECQQWWKLKNWEEIEKERGTRGCTVKKSSTTNLWNAIIGKHADAMEAFPEPIVLPRVQDDEEEANRLSMIVPVVLQMCDFEEVYSNCTWQKMQEGTGAYGVFWDKTLLNGLGDINIRQVNLLNLFWEPGITNIQDSSDIFYVSVEDNHVLEKQFPQLIGKLKKSAFDISKYKTDDSVPDSDKSLVVDWYYHKYDGPKKILHLVKFVGHEILFSSEDDPDMAQTGLYDDGDYPFVLDPLFPVAGSPAGYGYITVAKDTQIDIDTISQAMVQHTVVCSTPRHIIKSDGNINEEELMDISCPVVHTSGNLGENDYRTIDVPPMDGNSINIYQLKVDELKAATGNMDVMNGGTTGGVTAASALAAQQEAAGRSSRDSSGAAYRAYRRLVNMVIERIRQFYDLPRQFRIVGENGQNEFVSFSNAGMKPQLVQGIGTEDYYRLPVFDLEIHAQKENAYTKVSQNELAIQLYQLGFLNPQMIDQSLMAIDMMDFKGKDELRQKLSEMGGMQQMLQQVIQIASIEAQKAGDVAAVDQLNMIAQSSGMPPIAGGQPVDLKAGDEMGGDTKKENGIVEKAREHAANVSQPQ